MKITPESIVNRVRNQLHKTKSCKDFATKMAGSHLVDVVLPHTFHCSGVERCYFLLMFLQDIISANPDKKDFIIVSQDPLTTGGLEVIMNFDLVSPETTVIISISDHGSENRKDVSNWFGNGYLFSTTSQHCISLSTGHIAVVRERKEIPSINYIHSEHYIDEAEDYGLVLEDLNLFNNIVTGTKPIHIHVD